MKNRIPNQGALLLAGLIALSFGPEAGAQDAVTAITNAKIMTVGPAGNLEKGTILIKGGKITAVGANVAVPAGATVIDASGRVVTPGLIDAHSHTAMEDNVNECTNIVTAEVRVADVLDPRDISLYRQLAGGVTAANILHGSCNSVGGQNATIKLRYGAASGEALLFQGAPPGIKFALGENPKRASFGGGVRRYPATRMGVEVSLRNAFLEAKAYKKSWDDYEASVKAEKPEKGRPAKSGGPIQPGRRDGGLGGGSVQRPPAKKWSGWEDLNLRPPAPQAGALSRLRYIPTDVNVRTAESTSVRPDARLLLRKSLAIFDRGP